MIQLKKDTILDRQDVEEDGFGFSRLQSFPRGRSSPDRIQKELTMKISYSRVKIRIHCR